MREQRKLINFSRFLVQGKSLVFVNEIPILNADQLIKNGLVHEISKINLPKQLMDECNCIEPTKNQTNANLINKDILIREPKVSGALIDLNENNLDSNLLDSSPKSTIIPESMKRKYVTLHNRQYKPIAAQSGPNQSVGRPEAMFKPMVFYDLTDKSYYTTPSPKIPVPYHNNHNYYNPTYNYKNGTRVKPNFFVSDANSLAYPANSLPSYSALPSNNLTLESAFLTMFDPFSPYANQTFSNPRTQFHSVNASQPSPSMTYMTHIYHADNSQIYTNHAYPNQTPAFIYNMERLGIPTFDDRIRLEAERVQLPSGQPSNQFPSNQLQSNQLQSSTLRPYTKSVVYQVVPTVSSVSVPGFQQDYPTKSRNGRIPISSKYYNDLTTPTPMYFDPTRKPKSPSYLNRIRRVNDLINGQRDDGRLLSTSYQVLDSNVVQKIEDTKTSSNNKQQMVVPPRLDLNQLNQLTSNQFGSNRYQFGRNFKNRNQRIRPPHVTVSTVSSDSNQTTTRDGRLMKNFNRVANTPFITLLDVLKNPYLSINNEPVEFSYFESLLNQTSLSGLLGNRNGQLTLVLPTNSAFGRLKDYEQEFLKLPKSDPSRTDSSRREPTRSDSLYAMRRKRQLQRQDELRTQVIKNLVLNHISPILVQPDSIVSQVTAKSYSNYNLVFTRKANKLYLNDMPVLATTIVSNGVAYVVDNLVMNNRTLFEVGQSTDGRRKVSAVDSVLNPTLAGLDTSKLNSSSSVVQLIENIPELSFFTGLVKKSNYSNLLASSNGVYTVLAPENKAFSYLKHNVIDLLRNSQSFIDRFVGHHLIGGNFSLNNLVASPILQNLNRLPIKIENNNGMILLNGTSMVKRSNILAATGFIHILTHSILVKEPYASGNVMMLNRKPIFEEPTLQDQLMEIAKSRSSAKFLTLFIQHNYLTMLRSAKKNFTLLLPSDVAYYSLPENVINKMENSTAKLKTLLNYHLLNRLVDPYELATLDQLASSTGLPLHYANVTALNDQKPSSISLLNSEHSRLSLSYSIMANETQDSRRPLDHLANIRKLTEQLRSAADKNQLSLSGATIKEARLIEADGQSERGEKNYVEILFVDRVLYTPKGTIYDLIKSSPMLTVLKQLIEITNLKDELDWQLDDHDRHRHQPDQMKPNGYTFFAPSNSAFVSLLKRFESIKQNGI